MTLTVKNPSELNGAGKPGTPDQNSGGNGAQSSRSNPVCLETSVTIRSLPGESGGPTPPVREEAKTVIVFDNGAVLRSNNNLTVGRSLVLSNSGRDVVCRVVGGRNLPSIKGYVEVEFMEPVSDFWGIHQDPAPAGITMPPSPSPSRSDTAVSPVAPPAAPRTPPIMDTPPKPATPIAAGGRPLATAPAVPASTMSPASSPAKAGAPASGLGASSKIASEYTHAEYSHAELAVPESVANWRPEEPAPPAGKPALAELRQPRATASAPPTAARDFMNHGLMAYEQPGAASTASVGRTPMIVGVAALALAAICAVFFITHRNAAPVATAKAPIESQSAPQTQPPVSAKSAEPAPTPAQQDLTAQSAALTDAQPPAQAQTLPVDTLRATAAPAAVSALATSAAASESRTDSQNGQKQAKTGSGLRPPVAAPARPPAIANLKMSSPSAPRKNAAETGDGATQAAELAVSEPIGSTPPAGLLTSAGRTSNPPTPPLSAPAPPPVSAPKVVRDPKLISTVRPVYPATAKQANIQGSVTIFAEIDENGKVVSAKALNGPLLLRQAATESVKQWKYSPGTVDGKPAPSEVTVNVEFRTN